MTLLASVTVTSIGRLKKKSNKLVEVTRQTFQIVSFTIRQRSVAYSRLQFLLAVHAILWAHTWKHSVRQMIAAAAATATRTQRVEAPTATVTTSPEPFLDFII